MSENTEAAVKRYVAHAVSIEEAAAEAAMTVGDFKELCRARGLRLWPGSKRIFDHDAAFDSYNRMKSYKRVGDAFGVTPVAIFKAVRTIRRARAKARAIVAAAEGGAT